MNFELNFNTLNIIGQISLFCEDPSQNFCEQKKNYISDIDKNNTYGCRLGRFHPFIGHEGP